MEHDEYIARAMFRADQREQLRYAEDKGIEIGEAKGRDEGIAIGIEKGVAIGEARGREEVFALLRQGYSLEEAENLLAT